MYNHLSSGLIKLEDIGVPGHHRMMLDPKTPGCHYLLEDRDYYLKVIPLIGVELIPYDCGLIRLALKSAVFQDKNYWLMDYVYNETEFEVWTLKDAYSEAQMLDICKKLLGTTIHTLSDEKYQKEYGLDDGFGMMGCIFEGRIAPGLKINECGELPNGLEASFLICDPEAIIKEMFGENLSNIQKTRLLAEAKKMLSSSSSSSAKPIDEAQQAKARAKQQAKQEKRQKNWSRAKKGKADS